MSVTHTDQRFRPSVTVAAIVEREGRFLIVQERTPEGLKLNNPAGHLEQGESLIDACARECLEETAHPFVPQALLGIYMARQQRVRSGVLEDFTYVRFAYVGTVAELVPSQALDEGIEQALWLSADELRARSSEHRSPMLMRCVEDYLAGQRFPLEAVFTSETVVNPQEEPQKQPQALP
jgi:phosphatase NudJ